MTYGPARARNSSARAAISPPRCRAAGKPVTLIEAPNYNHFEMCETLGNPYGPNGRAAFKLMGLQSINANARDEPGHCRSR